ncbi:MAG: OmpA family protein [Cytophagales bacterium]|nr:OmpA family protein [Cytophagales bacterium]MDW8385080.1 OmpA family protein [Flammeovirgaceae bacterium]
MKKTLGGIAILVLTAQAHLFAQTAENRWGITFTSNFVDYNGLTAGNRPFDINNWNKAGRFTISRYLLRHLNAYGGFALGSVTNFQNLETTRQPFWDGDIGLQYPIIRSFTGKNPKIDPYLSVGVGFAKLGLTTSGLVTPGVGINFWLKEDFALVASTNYNHVFFANAFPFLQHDVGVAHIFGKPKDSDKDGIPDKDDACPLIAGEKYTQGCPDADKDSIADQKDKCPEEFGLAQFEGCPDSDGDGVQDSEDECPEVAGSMELKGCPDADGDGIKDSEDECPKQSGPVAFQGCPDSDNDGIPDPKDKCPKEPGGIEEGGCPKKEVLAKEEPKPSKTTDTGIGSDLIFYLPMRADIQDEYKPMLDKLVNNLKNNPKNTVEIEGHADASGNDAINNPLARRRAENVANYLIKQGIKPNRIKVSSYGSKRPMVPNDTPENRAKNRRVKIILVAPAE